MFGLLEIHGPIQAVFDQHGDVKAEPNPYGWSKRANMIYIDNPVGAGFSYSDKLPSTEEEVENDLYEFLIQWFTLFPQYQVTKKYCTLFKMALYLYHANFWILNTLGCYNFF